MEELKKELKELFNRDSKFSALKKRLKELIPSQPPEFEREYNSWVAGTRDLASKRRKGILTFEQENVYRNQLGDNVLGLIDSLLTEEEVKELTSQQAEETKQQEDAKEAEKKETHKFKVLFLASNPKDTGWLQVASELEQVRESIRRATFRDDFLMERYHAVSPLSLSRALLDFTPNIVHFSGHGVELDASPSPPEEGSRSLMFEEVEDEALSGGIALEDEQGNTVIVDAEDLGALFKLYAGQIQCVLLNACHSKLQADAIIQHVPYVIGMNRAIPDKTAIRFAIAFYDALGAGKDIPFAFAHAKANIGLAGLPGKDIPELITQEASS